VHPLDLPGYPGPTDIALYGLKKQGMYCEKEVKAEIEWHFTIEMSRTCPFSGALVPSPINNAK
jgi:hypothetical protein